MKSKALFVTLLCLFGSALGLSQVLREVRVTEIPGVVMAGAATGIKGIRAAAIPVWAVGGTTITGHHRVETIEINGPIGMRGVRVEPGDLVVADDSGVTIVPLSLVESVLQQAEKTSRLSAPLRTAIESGDDREDLRNVLRRWWKDYARLGKDV